MKQRTFCMPRGNAGGQQSEAKKWKGFVGKSSGTRSKQKKQTNLRELEGI